MPFSGLLVNLVRARGPWGRAGIERDPKLAMRLLSEIHETTLVYPPAGGKQGRPKLRTRLAEMHSTQRQLLDAVALAQLAPAS
jgi:hypothetical protein